MKCTNCGMEMSLIETVTDVTDGNGHIIGSGTEAIIKCDYCDNSVGYTLEQPSTLKIVTSKTTYGTAVF